MTTTPKNIEYLRTRLRVGQQWLTREYQRWLVGDPQAATDERFSRALAGWDALERILRQLYEYQGCIFGPAQSCPEDAPVQCDGCLVDSGPPLMRQLSLALTS
jgi:hypothetical protein